jgi:CheY-like chemotaxis protein
MKSAKGRPRGAGGAPTRAPSIDFGPAFADPSATPSQPGAAARSMRLLVVDDDRHVADALVLLLQSLGHEVGVAYSGAEGIELAARLDAQVVLLDIGMAGMDGFETARRLRAAESGTTCRRLVAVSGYGDEAFLAACQEAGFDARLVKPVSRRMLTELLDELG